MLSYRHAFHAGNFADVIKHIVLVEILEHLTKKDTAFEYIDTHSGVGLYRLDSTDAQKLHEYSDGIGKLHPKDFPELERYFEVIYSLNNGEQLDVYPGSPFFAKHFLRKQDRAWLFELHPQDFQSLSNNVATSKNIRAQCQNGFDGLKALLPPASRRAVVLIDPSYEIKSEYAEVVDRTLQAYKKFSQGIYALWYPVVERSTIDTLEKKFVQSGVKNIQRFELGVSEDTEERGMTSSGMIVINPPWTLFSKMSALLPRLAEQLSKTGNPIYKCDTLVGE